MRFSIRLSCSVMLFVVLMMRVPDCRESDGNVYVVYCIDTETAAFNYGKFKQSLNLNNFIPNNAIDQTLDKNWRSGLKDSNGHALKFTYYLMTIEAYRNSYHGINAIGNIFFRNFSEKIKIFGDEVGWHYHHADWFRDKVTNKLGWNKIETFSGSVYREKTDRQLAMSQLASFIYLNRFYPSTYRAGWIWENEDLSNWLDSLIPTDYSNNWDEVDEIYFMYHPNSRNLYAEGELSRCIVRSVEKDTTYMEKLFKRASAGESVIFSHYTHSYGYTKTFNTMKSLAEWRHRQLVDLSSKYNVDFVYCTASEAVNIILGNQCTELFELSLQYDSVNMSLSTGLNNSLFGTPLLCYQLKDGNIEGLFMASDKNQDKWAISLRHLSDSIVSFIVASVNKCGDYFISKEYVIEQ